MAMFLRWAYGGGPPRAIVRLLAASAFVMESSISPFILSHRRSSPGEAPMGGAKPGLHFSNRLNAGE